MFNFEIISITFKKSMGKIDKDIRDKYDFYNKLLAERKSVFESVIDISGIANNSNFLENNTSISHESIQVDIDFIVNVKINNSTYFQFKLRCRELSDTPFFRFDSDGETHRNYSNDIPLREQSISTPHFHKYNQRGACMAYKTDRLLNEKESKALEDINICIAYFCHESNVRLNQDDFPTVTIRSKEIPLDFSVIDPLSNIKF